MQEQTQILNHAANQLSNILSMMSGSLKYIETTHPEVRCYKYWFDICSDAAHMQEIIHNLTGYSQSDTLILERTDLQKLLRGSCLSCMPLTEGTQKKLTFTSRTNGPCLMLDSCKIREVFINLIKNALEAIKDDGWVHVTLSRDSSKAIIQIEDNGCGIAPEQLLTIFNPFVSYKQGGTGLGLSIVKRILDAHHAGISVSSSLYSGTTFTLSFYSNT